LNDFSTVIFLDAINGITKLSDDFWNKVSEFDVEVAYVTFGIAVNDIRISKIFGCSSAYETQVKEAYVSDNLITENLPKIINLNRREILSKPTSGLSLIYINNNPKKSLLVINNNNVWIGLTELTEGVISRYPYLITLLKNILKLNSYGYAIIKIPYRYVAIRIDDIPYSTESWFFNWEYFTPEEYEKFFDILRQHNAHVDFLIIPFNVSKKDGSWVSYYEIFPEEIQVIKTAVMEGLVEVGDHGATHVTPYQEFYLNEKTTDPVKLTSAIRFEFGFEPHLKKKISYELQREHIEKGTREIEKWFGVKVEVFTPPWHVWDETTEQIVGELGFKVFSGDFRFKEGWVGQPPCIMGEINSGDVMYVPMTHSWDLVRDGDEHILRYYISPFIENGIPVVFLSHGRNWTFMSYSEVFTLRNFEETLFKLEKVFEPDYATLGEIGDFLYTWHDLHVEYDVMKDYIMITVKTPEEISISIEHFKSNKEVKRIYVNNNVIERGKDQIIKIQKGENTIKIEFEEKRLFPQLMNIMIIIVILAISIALIIIFKKRK